MPNEISVALYNAVAGGDWLPKPVASEGLC